VKFAERNANLNAPLNNDTDTLDQFQYFILVAPVLLFSMVAHEYAHGYAALKQGDTGTMAFGGAKPVPVVPRNYRNFKRGDIIVSLAGVATNLVIALACIPLIIIVGLVGSSFRQLATTGALVQTMLRFGIVINLSLVAFNLIPIPPLDGSHVFKYFLPPAWALNYQRLGAQGLLILIVLLTFGRPLLNLWFAPVFFLDTVATRAVFPYIIPSPWTM